MTCKYVYGMIVCMAWCDVVLMPCLQPFALRITCKSMITVYPF